MKNFQIEEQDRININTRSDIRELQLKVFRLRESSPDETWFEDLQVEDEYAVHEYLENHANEDIISISLKHLMDFRKEIIDKWRRRRTGALRQKQFA